MYINNNFTNTNCLISLKDSICRLRKGEIIAYPTESMFGLGCDPDSKYSVMKLIKIKKRSINKGFILLAAHYSQLKPYLLDKKISSFHRKKMFVYWPGHVTFLLPVKNNVPSWLVGKSKFIAVRITSHPVARKICMYFGKAIISTSANLTGKLPCRTKKDFYNQFGDSIALLDGNIGTKCQPSKILNIITGEVIRNG